MTPRSLRRLIERNAPALFVSGVVMVVGLVLVAPVSVSDPRFGVDLGFALLAAGLAGGITAVGVTEAEHRRTRDLRSAAIEQIVAASYALCVRPAITYRIFESGLTGIGARTLTTLGAFVEELHRGDDVADWHALTAQRDVAIAAAALRWSAVADDLRTARDAFVRELASFYLLPPDAARAVTEARAQIATAADEADRGADALKQLAYLELSGGLPEYKRQHDEAWSRSRTRVRTALDGVLAAHATLERAGRREIPTRMAEMFPPFDPVVAEEVVHDLATAAIKEVADYAQRVPTDAAAVDPEWLRYSTLGARLSDVAFADILFEDFGFDADHAMNGWLTVAAACSRAKERFAGPTLKASYDLTKDAAGERDALIAGLSHCYDAANAIYTQYGLHPYASDDLLTATAPGRAAFRASGHGVLEAVRRLQTLADSG